MLISHRRIGQAALLTAMVGLAAPFASARQEGSNEALLVRRGTLIDGTGAPARDATSVLIVDGKIAATGVKAEAAAPAGSRVIDAAGKFVLPGLIDSHVHYLDWETPWYPYFGVTTIFDLGNLSEWIVSQRAAQRAGHIPGARLYTTGNHLNGPAKPGDELRSADRAGWIHIVSDEKTTLEALQVLNSYPVDGLKIQERLNEESLKTIVAFGEKHRLPLVGHTVNARDAANLGIRFIEHMTPIARATGTGRDRDMDPTRFPDLIKLLVEKKVVINPTLALLYVQASRYNDDFRREDKQLFPTFTGVPQFVKDTWMHEFYEDDELTASKKESLPKVAAFLKAFVDRGGRILSGTDAGRRAMPGLSLHREMQMLVGDVGLSPMEAIKSTTSYPAEFLGLRDVGTIVVGKKGDLLILDADPLADIANTRKIAHVIMNGEVIDRGPKLTTYKNPLPRPVSDEPIPVIDSVTPMRLTRGHANVVITVRGQNFIPDTVLQIAGTNVDSQRQSDGSLRVVVPAQVLGAVGTYPVVAINPLPGGGHSNSRYFYVDYPTSPVKQK